MKQSIASSHGKRHHAKNEMERSNKDRASLSPLGAEDSGTKDRQKTSAESKSKSQHKTKDLAGSEKDKSRQQRGWKTAEESKKRKHRTDSTSSASSDSSSSSGSSSSSASSSSGSTTSSTSSTSMSPSPKKQRKHTTTKSKSDAQQTTSGSSLKAPRSRDAARKLSDKLDSKTLGKDSNRRPREKLHGDGSKEQSFHGGKNTLCLTSAQIS